MTSRAGIFCQLMTTWVKGLRLCLRPSLQLLVINCQQSLSISYYLLISIEAIIHQIILCGRANWLQQNDLAIKSRISPQLKLSFLPLQPEFSPAPELSSTF